MALPLPAAASEERGEAEEQEPALQPYAPPGYAQLPSDRLAPDERDPNAAGGHVVTVNGMEFHIYGDLSGLRLSDADASSSTLLFPDSDEEEEDETERKQAEAAILRANVAEAARRSAPLPPERCQAIKNAMSTISLGGFRPDWADMVSEEQWVRGLKKKLMQDSGVASSG